MVKTLFIVRTLPFNLFKAYKMTSIKNLRPIVVCGPSGSGKTSLVNRLMKEFQSNLGFSVSHTTRKPRPGEKDGQHYHFITKEQMLEDIKYGKFIETATFGGNMYGTSKAAISDITNSGKICILEIDIQGVRQIKKTDFNPWFIFIEPPSIEALESRLRARNTETEEGITQRLKIAEEELSYGKTPGNFHLIITNDDLEKAYHILRTFVVECLHSS